MLGIACLPLSRFSNSPCSRAARSSAPLLQLGPRPSDLICTPNLRRPAQGSPSTGRPMCSRPDPQPPLLFHSWPPNKELCRSVPFAHCAPGSAHPLHSDPAFLTTAAATYAKGRATDGGWQRSPRPRFPQSSASPCPRPLRSAATSPSRLEALPRATTSRWGGDYSGQAAWERVTPMPGSGAGRGSLPPTTTAPAPGCPGRGDRGTHPASG